MTTIRVAVGVMMDHESRVCVTQRLKGTHLEGLWEFPGGKVEEGESVEHALAREFLEELSVTVTSCAPLMTVTHQYPEKCVQLEIREILAFEGEARGAEGQALQWVSVEALETMPFPDANVPIIKALKDRRR